MNAAASPQELRVALYSHDSLGLGHTRRNLAIAQALSDTLPGLTGRTVSGLLITGERTATSYRCPEGFDWVVVPGIRKGEGRYEPRTLAVGTNRLFDIRSAVISGALASFRPHIVIVDRHAFGVDGELDEPLRALKAAKPDTSFVLGLREVLDAPEVARAEWEKIGIDRVAELFDRIWVYGDRAVHDPLATGELPAEFAPMVDHTGLLSDGRKTSGRSPAARRPFVVTMLGGGSDGGAVARAAAAAPVPDGMQHLVVTGPQMPAEVRAEVEADAGPATKVTTKVSDGLSYVAGAEAAITMGGYNTIAETLSTDTPALVVPRTLPRAEQLIRARGLAQAGAIDMLDPSEVTPEAIGEWLASAVATGEAAARQSAARAGLDLAGLGHVVDLAASLSWRTDRAVEPLPAGPTDADAAVPVGAVSADAAAPTGALGSTPLVRPTSAAASAGPAALVALTGSGIAASIAGVVHAAV